MKKLFAILMISLMVLNLPVTIVYSKGSQSDNITFTDPYWTMYKQSDAFISNAVNTMKNMGINYQMIDLGYFDKNADTGQMLASITGTMKPKHTLYLQKWIELSRKTAPEMNLIGLINGSSYLHVQGTNQTIGGKKYTPKITKAEMHDKIADYAFTLVDTYGLDGICLDFEPIFDNLTIDYIDLIIEIRHRIGDDKTIAICGSIDPYAMNDTNILKLAPVIDIFISMDYDTQMKKEIDYIEYISKHVSRISKIFQDTSVTYFPLGPGVYPNNEWHTEIENTRTHSLALQKAIENTNAIFAGSGVWWFAETIKNPAEIQDFITFWLQYQQNSK